MIKPNELRIGNYIKGLTGAEYEVVCELSHRIYTDGSNSYNANHVEPIPLTKEILLKCGFEVKDDNPKQKPHYEGDILVNICNFEFSNSMIDGFDCYELSPNRIFKYLHELQNLYFCLRGEELKIEL